MSDKVELNFKRGNSSNLPMIGVDGAFYLTKDTNKLFHSLGGSLNPINVCKAHYFSTEEDLQENTVFGDRISCTSQYQVGDSIYIDGQYHCRVADIADLYAKTSSKWISSHSLELVDGNSTTYARLTLISIGGGSYRFEVTKYSEPEFAPYQASFYSILIAQFDDGEVPLYRIPSSYSDVHVLSSDGNTPLGMHLTLNTMWWPSEEVENLCTIGLDIIVGDTFDVMSLNGLVIHLSNTHLLFDDSNGQQLTWEVGDYGVYGRTVYPTVDGISADINCGSISTSWVNTGGMSLSYGLCNVYDTDISGYGNNISMHIDTLNISTSYGVDCLMEFIGDDYANKGYLRIPNLITGEEFASPRIRNVGDAATFSGNMSVYVTTELPASRNSDTIYILTE